MIDETYIMKHKFSGDRKAATALVIIVMVLLLLGGRHFEKLSNHSYLQDLRLSETLELIEVREELELYVFEHILRLEELSSFVGNNPDMTQEEFSQTASRLLETTPDILNFAVARDMVVSHVYPLQENQYVLGMDYREMPGLLEQVNKAIAKRSVVLTGPITSLDGEYLMFFRAPIYVPAPLAGAGEQLWGVATIVVRLEDMLEHAGFQDMAKSVDFLILSEDEEAGELTFVAGDPSIQEQAPVTLELDFPNGSWEVLTIPSGGWPTTAPTQSRDRWIVFLMGLFCLSILAYIIYISRSHRLARTRLSSAIGAMEDGFAMFDTEQKLVKCNENYVRAFGEISEITKPGVSLATLLKEGVKRGQFVDAFGNEEEWLSARLDEISRPHARNDMRLSNGMFVHASIRRTSEGGSVVILSDVTQLKNAVERSQAANEAKSQFISTLSHELRTPLTVVLGLAKLTHEIERQPAYAALEKALQNDPVDVEECRKAMRGLADHIKSVTGKQTNSASYLLELINEMLDFSKIESGRLDIEVTECEIGDLVATVEQQMRPLMEDKRLEFVVEYEAGKVLADGKRTRQILTNMLGNAAKFTERGFVALTVTQRDGEVRFNVEDSGPGIEEADRQRIFEPFEQVDSSLTRSKTGTGLGLAISRKLARAQSGDLFVESTPGKGSLFTLVLKPVESHEEQTRLSA